MAITFVGAEIGDEDNIVPRPAGAASGDVLLLLHSVSATSPAGWTGLATQDWGIFYTATFAYRVIVDILTEPTSWDFDGSNGMAMIVAFRGVDTSNPTSSALVSVASSGISATLPAITTTSANCLIVSFGVRQTEYFGSATSMALLTSISRAHYFTVFTRSTTTTGEYSASAHTGVNSRNAAVFGVALRPAGGGPPPVTAKPWSYAQVIE